MNEKILVPLDGSKIGEAALPYVEEIVSKLSPKVKAEITLLQVISPASPPQVSGRAVEGIPYTANQLEETKDKAAEYLNKAGEALSDKGAKVDVKVGVGSPAEEIVKTADEIGANIIAMSTHGRAGISRWAFGSITDKVLRHEESVPILIVRAPKKHKKA